MKNDTYSYVALGSFDGLHKGHLSLIKKTVELAKKINGMSIVYTFKNHPRKFIKSIDNPKLLLDNESKKEILKKENAPNLKKFGAKLVEVTRFELATPSSRTMCATKLRYTSK